MDIESIRLLNGVGGFIGDAVTVTTRNVPEEGAKFWLASVYCRPSVHVPHDASQAAAPLDDPSGRIAIKVRPSRTADAVVRGGNTRVEPLTHHWEDMT